MNKPVNQKAWFFVTPVLLLVAFNAIVPLMTVVNYSIQETFGSNVFLWSGLIWFEELLRSPRFQDSLGRQFFFTFTILAIQIPLGVIIALAMPRKGFWVSVCLILMALPLLIPWNVVGAMWNIFALPEIGLLGKTLNTLGFDYNYTRQSGAAWFTTDHNGCLALDLAGCSVVLRRTGINSRCPIIRRRGLMVPVPGQFSAISNCRK